MTLTSPLLTIDDARIDMTCGGQLLCEHLTVSCGGQRLAIAGPGAIAVSHLLCGRATVVAGTIAIAGRDVVRSQHLGVVGIAPCDPPMPPKLSALDYVALSYSACGLSTRAAMSRANSIFDELGLRMIARTRLSSADHGQRRAIAIAAAMLPGAEVLFAECPLLDLGPIAAGQLLALLGHVARTRAVIVSVSRTDNASSETQIMAGADQFAWLDARGACWVGPFAELARNAKVFVVGTCGDPAGLERCFVERQWQVSGAGNRVIVKLPLAASATEILQAAASANVEVTDLVPIC